MNLAPAKRLGSFIWKTLFGVFLCQISVTSIMALGWMMRVMQRSALIAWLGKAALPERHQHWPNWFLKNRSFVENWKIGFTGILNVWVCTLPGCLLWAFSWYAGWNNSFHKGYELAWVGPTTGMVGIGLFILAMFYVPMAQARQAVTGEWRRFYDFRTVRKVIRRQWLACFWLAALYALANVPIMVLKTGPFFLSQTPDVLAISTPAEAKKWLSDYFLAVTFIVFPLALSLRILAARIYARGVILLLREQRLLPEEISAFEQKAFDLIEVEPKAQPHLILKTMSTVARWGTGIAMVIVWFLFVAQIYVAQFLLYHPRQGWLNQPAVHLPWFQYMPKALQDLDDKEAPPDIP